MATLLVVLFVLSLFHFVYDGIIAPSERTKIRYKLFKIRDDIRMLKIEHKNEIPDDLFNDIDNSVNTSINSLPYINILVMVRAFNEFKKNESLRESAERKINRINNCKVPAVKEAYSNLHKQVGISFLINMGGWMPYLILPLFLFIIVLCVDHFYRKVFKSFNQQIDMVLNAPSKEIKILMPESMYAPAVY